MNVQLGQIKVLCTNTQQINLRKEIETTQLNVWSRIVTFALTQNEKVLTNNNPNDTTAQLEFYASKQSMD